MLFSFIFSQNISHPLAAHSKQPIPLTDISPLNRMQLSVSILTTTGLPTSGLHNRFAIAAALRLFLSIAAASAFKEQLFVFCFQTPSLTCFRKSFLPPLFLAYAMVAMHATLKKFSF